MSFVIVVHMMLGVLPYDVGDGRHGDVDVDDLRLYRLGAPKMIDLVAAALKMTKGK